MRCSSRQPAPRERRRDDSTRDEFRHEAANLPPGRRRRRGGAGALEAVSAGPGAPVSRDRRGGRLHASRSRRLRRLAGPLPRALGLGQGRQGHALRELLVPGSLRLERLREGRPGLARGAGRLVPPDESPRPRPQPPGLPEGRMFQRAHVRSLAGSLPAQARGPARLGQVEATLLGRGEPRDRLRVPGYAGAGGAGSVPRAPWPRATSASRFCWTPPIST